MTRRCTQRQFLLHPDETTRRIFLYCLAVAAARCGIDLVAWSAMSNHYHAVIVDRLGRLPEFMAYFHRLTAKALNTRWNRWENLWASEQPNACLLVGSGDILDKVVYTLANPVFAHLVDRAADWPGANSFAHLDGTPITVTRPNIFFAADGCMPDEVQVVARRPPGFEHLSSEEWAQCVKTAVEQAEEEARAERLARHIPLVGRKAIRRMTPGACPSTPAQHRRHRPVLVCRNLTERTRELCAIRCFRAAHAAARARLAAGEPEVTFPAGTYQMRRLLGPRCIVLDGPGGNAAAAAA